MRDSDGGFWEQVSTLVTKVYAEQTPILALSGLSLGGGCCLEVLRVKSMALKRISEHTVETPRRMGGTGPPMS